MTRPSPGGAPFRSASRAPMALPLQSELEKVEAANRAVTSLRYGSALPQPIRGPVEFRAVPRVQNVIAVLAVAAAIAMLGLKLAVPRMSLLATEPPFAYADAS